MTMPEEKQPYNVLEEVEEILEAQVPIEHQEKLPSEEDWEKYSYEEKEATAKRIAGLIAEEEKKVRESREYSRKAGYREKAISLGVGSAYERWYTSVWKESGYEPADGEILLWLEKEKEKIQTAAAREADIREREWARERRQIALEEAREEREGERLEREAAREEREKKGREEKAGVAVREAPRPMAPVRAPAIRPSRLPTQVATRTRTPTFGLDRLKQAGAITARRPSLADTPIGQIGRQPMTFGARPTTRPTIWPTTQTTQLQEIPVELEAGFQPGEMVVEGYQGDVYFWVGPKRRWELGSDIYITQMATDSYRFVGLDRRGTPRSKIIGKDIGAADRVALKRG